MIKKRKKSSVKNEVWGWAMASPPIIGILLFVLLPLIFSLVVSVCDLKGYILEDMEFLGFANMFANFKYVLTDNLFWKSVLNTLIAGLSLPISLVGSLIIAIVLNQKMRGKTLFRTLFFLPFVCSVVALTSMWRLVLDENYGILNQFLGIFNIAPIGWLSSPKFFLPAMILMGAWTSMGFNVILFSAALTNINKSYYEAAKMDGANTVQQFFKITIPAISPTTFYLLVMGVISALQEFTRFEAINFGGTGPNNTGLTVVYYLYRMAFVNNWTYGMGVAAATSWIVAVIILGITVINFTLSKKWVHYD